MVRALVLLLVAFPLFAAEPRAKVPDVTMTNERGESVRFSDLTRGRTVAINFVFTTCTTICTPMGATFGSLQPLVESKKNVKLISVSIDPAIDTPERLRKWSAQFGARPVWTLLTGPRADVDKLLKTFGLYTPDRFAHSPTVVVLAADGRWTRINGIGNARAIAGAMEELSR